MIEPLRTNELLAAFSLAMDRSTGVTNEASLRMALLAASIARAMGLSETEQSDCYYTALLRYVGCSGYATETAYQGVGDDLGFLRAFEDADAVDLPGLLRRAFTRLARDETFVRRAQAIGRFLADPKAFVPFARAHCAQATALARALLMTEPVCASLTQIYERWDGRGPTLLRGEEISLEARVLHCAMLVEVHFRLNGENGVRRVLAERSGTQLDPTVVNALLSVLPTVLERISAPSVWDDFLLAEPGAKRTLTPSGLTELAEVFGRYADLKSPWRLGHSAMVADLCVRAAKHLGLSEEDCRNLAIAGHVHDVGIVSIVNGILDKPTALSAAERALVQQHVSESERIVSATNSLAPVVALIAQSHERGDGSGYPRQQHSPSSIAAAVLAASDMWVAMKQERPYRAALSSEAATVALLKAAKDRALDGAAVSAVLAVCGQKQRATIRPAGLSEREAVVLVELARGRSNKEIASILGISPRTVQEHVAHIYEKTEVNSRAAAALFASQNGLCRIE